jgi:hypothetical protein
MKFVFFFSPTYEFYNYHITSILKNIPSFVVKPILINDVINTQKNKHHFDGINIKIELIIEQIKQNMGETIVFSDATIFINEKNSNKLYEYLLQYTEDLVFINEFQNNCYNIGVMLIKCNEKTLRFFEQVLYLLNTKTFTHDQACINNFIKKNPDISINVFGKEIYCCSYFIEKERDNFIIYKSFIPNAGNVTDNFNFRIQHFYNLKLIDNSMYNYWYKKN